MDPAVEPAFEVWWLGHVGGLGLAGLVWFRRTSMLEPEVFVEYGSGWGLVFCVVVCVETDLGACPREVKLL